jgi:hypothetical protein
MVCVGKTRSSNRLPVALNDGYSEVGCPSPTTVSMEPRRAVVAVPDTRNWVRSLNASNRFDGSASYDRGLSGASCPLWSVVPACWRFVIWWQLVTA